VGLLNDDEELMIGVRNYKKRGRDHGRSGMKHSTGTRIITASLALSVILSSFISSTISFPTDLLGSVQSFRCNIGDRSMIQSKLALLSLSKSQSLPPDFSTSNNKKKIHNNNTNITIEDAGHSCHDRIKVGRQLFFSTNDNKKTSITVQNQLPLRTVEYRRRKHEWAKRYTSQNGLREAFGSNRNRFWGDLDAKTARRLYKKLLFPTALSELVLELGDEIIRPEELAPLAYEARKAAKLYVRERCKIPSRVGAYLYDGFRQFRKYGKFQMDGDTYEQLWIRYYHERDDDDDNDDGNEVVDDVDDAVTEEEIIMQTCQKILEKSCTTNEAIDRFFLKKYNETKEDCDDSDENDHKRKHLSLRDGRQRWRRRRRNVDRYNNLLLKRITKTLERDVRKLLAPPPSLSSSLEDLHHEKNGECEKRKDNNNQNNNNSNDIGTTEKNSSSPLSSRRMTQQEYHSLKLFAKARKNSQQQTTYE